ncbi:hypothetical protein Lesp02_57020 [Lentzea sp. NBRC 105346]|uniref:EndoU domain-containing protein n=1 Tax=Lentzea sp. NBRC 105346 TaxID=3032205 RepID=UPI0024A31176|nr:RHS repeat-associated core domain-containing protein [Lentzea sp. NBRC 105346]GLZ33514.1 hypothetical protein Lesp02_57020 [Lentzea sp. NBRC 105346]
MTRNRVVRMLSLFTAGVLALQVAAVSNGAAQAATPAQPPAAVNPAPVVQTVMTPGPTILDGVHIKTDTVWGPQGSPYVIRNQVKIESQASLTLLPGTVVKFDGQPDYYQALIWVDGPLLSLGTPDRHVVFTSYKDDSVGGDTNGDGSATAPVPGDYTGLKIGFATPRTTTVSALDYTDMRYGGRGSGGLCGAAGQVDIAYDARVVISNSSFTDAHYNAISIGNIGANGFVGVYNSNFDRSRCGINTWSSQVEVIGNTFGSSFGYRSLLANAATKLRMWFNTFGSGPSVIGGSPRPTRATADVRYNTFQAGVNHWYPSSQDLDDWSQNWWGYNVNTFALPACATTAQANAATPPWSLNTSTICGDSPSYTYPVTGYSKPVLPTLSGAPGTVPGGVNEASAPRYGPVNTQSGALTYQASDLVMQDAGKQVTATRTYRSDVTTGDAGKGWTSAFSEALSTANGVATMSTSDGQSIAFGTDPAAGYVPAPGVSAGFSSGAGGSEVTTPGLETYQFDPNGALTGMLLGDPGHKLTIGRSGGQLDRVTGVSGRRLDYGRSDGKLRSVTDSTGRSVSFGYGEGDLLASATGVDGKTETYTYEGGRLTKVTTPSGRTLLAAGYGADGKVAWIEQEGAGRSTFSYDPANRRTTIDLPDGSHVRQDYDTSGRLVTDQVIGGSGRHVIYDAEGRATVVVTGVPTVPMTGFGPAAETTFFDRNGDPAMRVDPLGVTVRTTFTGHKPAVTTFADNTTITRTYDAAGRLATVTDQHGKLWRYTFNDRGQATGRTDPLGRTATYAYAANGDRTGVTDELGSATGYETDAQGRPVAITDPAGRRRTIAYTAWDEPERITQPRGGVYTVTFDDDRRKTGSSDPTGAVTRYEYDGSGRLGATVDPAGGRTTVEYDAAGRPTKITNPRGGVLQRTYSAEGWPTSATDPAGAVTRTEYDPAGRGIRVTDALNQVTQTVFDRAGRATAVQTPDGAKRTFAYDTVGRTSQSVTPLGGKWLQAYDAAGNPTTTTDPLGKTIVIGYDEVGRAVTRTDQNGVVTSVAYDDAARTVTISDPLGVVSVVTSNAAGEVVRAANGRGDVSTSAYDADGNLVSQTAATGGTTTFTYDPAGHATGVSDPLGRVTSAEYDGLARLVKRTWPDASTERFTYDAVGNLTAHTDRTGSTSEYTYDAANRVTVEKNPLAKETRHTYDALGRRTSTVDPTGVLSAIGYDPAGRPAVRSDTNGASWVDTYDLNGNVLTSTDPSGVKITNTYDALNRLTRVASVGYDRVLGYDAASRLVSYSDEFNQVTKFEYDARGRRTADVDPLQQRTTRGYDAAGNVVTVTPPSGHAQTRTYDGSGRVATAADALGNTSRYTYDAAGELTALTLPRGGGYGYHYDLAGRLSSETDPLGATTTFEHDNEGRLTKTTRPSGRVVSAQYDAAGRLTQRTAGSDTRTYGYDDAGRITSAGALGFGYDNRGLRVRGTDAGGDTTYAYDAAHRLSATTPPGGVATTYTYDGYGRLSQVRGGTNLNYSYSYISRKVTKSAVSPTTGSESRYLDVARHTTSITGASSYEVKAQYSADGQVSSLTQTAPGNAASNTTAYGYDDAGRLASATLSRNGAVVSTTNYGWDANGNRTSVATTGQSTVVSDYDAADRLTGSSDGSAYTYDADGNLTDVAKPGSPATHYDYNGFGELVRSGTGTSTVDYSRDAFGRMSGSGAQQLSYDGVSTTLSQMRGTATTDLVREPNGTPLAEATHGSTSARLWPTIHGDLGMVADASSGTVRQTAVYDAFGKATTTGSAPVPLGFQSMFTDPATGLVDMGARTYDATTGRFTTADDVIGDLTKPVTLNRYTYGNADPLDFFDPDGHWSLPGWDAVKSAFTTVVNWVSDRVEDVSNAVSSAVSTIAKNVTEQPWRVGLGVLGVLLPGSVGSVVQSHAAQIITDVKDTFYKLVGDPKALLKTVATVAVGAVTFVACEAASVGVGTIGCAVLAGAAAGAVSGALDCPDGQAVLSCVGRGAVAGGVGGLVFGLTLGAGPIVAGALAGAASDVVSQYLATGRVDVDHVAAAGIFGGLTGGLAKAGAAVGRSIKGAAPAVGRAVNGLKDRVRSVDLRDDRGSIKLGGGADEPAPKPSASQTEKSTPEFVDLVSPARRAHILDGEVRPNGTYGGGHRPGTGYPRKSEFPARWSDDEIMHHISDVATDPHITWRTGDRPGDFWVNGTRDGIDIEVLIRRNEIWTAYPTNTPRNP